MLKAKVLGALVAFGALGVCSAAYADNTGTAGAGFYVGGNVGLGEANYGDMFKNAMQSAPTHSTSEGGLAGRAFVGYQFNEYFGIETGYTQFSDNEYKGSDSVTSADFKLKTWTADVLGKAILPFSAISGSCNPFSIYAQAGVAYVNADIDVSASGPVEDANGNATSYYVSGSHSSNEWKPVAGAGMSFNFNKNLSMDVSYLHTFGSDTTPTSHDLNAPSTDYVGLGVTYHFA